MDEAISQVELARRINRSPRLVRKLTDQDVLPRNEDGTYPWPEAHEAWVHHKEFERDRRHGPRGAFNLQEELARKAAAQADEAELKVGRQLGLLIHVDDVERMVLEPIEQVEATLRSAGSRYAAELARKARIKPAAAKRILEDIFEEVRADLRRIRERGDERGAA